MLEIEWLGHDGFRLRDDKVVYIDPWQIRPGPKADLILVTHDHFDHCSPEDIEKISTPNTTIVAALNAVGRLRGNVRGVKAGDRLKEQGIGIEVVAAYNVNKFRSPGVPFHPKEYGGVGYIVEMAGERIYHTGDSDPIPEMDAVQCTVALLPVSGLYVMTAEEAAQAAQRLEPKTLIPMHYGAIAGSAADAQRLKELCPMMEVRILAKI